MLAEPTMGLTENWKDFFDELLFGLQFLQWTLVRRLVRLVGRRGHLNRFGDHDVLAVH